MLSPARLRNTLLLPFAVWLGFATGCSSDSHPDHEGPINIPDYPTAMTGSENFLDGKVAVEVTLGMPTDFHPGKGDSRSGGSGGAGGGHRHGGGGGHRGGGGMGGYGAGDQAPAGDSDDDTPRPRVVGSTLPPAQLKIHLKNTTNGETISCEVADFSSSLGNFAVYPATYKLEAGQSATSETMTSRLGVESSTIPVTVGVRSGNGEIERKVLTLRLIPDTEKSAPPAPATK
jgi:hypothetical protein